MTQTKRKFATFEEYLSYDDGSDRLYELLNGELVELPPESGENVGIANFLFVQFASLVGYLRVRAHGLELEVRGEPKNRFPDLTILREEHIEQLKRRNTIRLSMAPPLLVIEVVSLGEENQARDYIDKRNQYQDRNIPEYWLVDPQQEIITVLWLEGESYQEFGIFRKTERLQSPTFPTFPISAVQILQAG